MSNRFLGQGNTALLCSIVTKKCTRLVVLAKKISHNSLKISRDSLKSSQKNRSEQKWDRNAHSQSLLNRSKIGSVITMIWFQS